MARQPVSAAPLAAKWRKLAEGRCAEKGERLTPARLAVYAEMLARDRPVSAYDLIGLLERRQKRKIAPLTVYRHLDFLIRTGLVHRLQSAQTYLPCGHPDHAHESQFLPLLLVRPCGRGGIEEPGEDAVTDRGRARLPARQRGCGGQGVVRRLRRRRTGLNALRLLVPLRTGASRLGKQRLSASDRLRL